MIPPIEQDIPRDRWGRPVLDGVTYTRVSTLAKTLDDMGGLMLWGERQTALGLATSEDLIAAVATTPPDDTRTLNRIVEQAKERAKSRSGATLGTAVHTASETADRDGDISLLPDKIRADVTAYRDLIRAKGLVPLAAEVFVVCPELRCAGTFDRLMAGPNRTVVVDVKTSGKPGTARFAGLAWAIQTGVYAHSYPWVAGRGILAWEDIGLPSPDLGRAVIVDIVRGTGTATLHTVDLNIGWTAAHLACEVRDMRALKNITTPIP